jgi:glycosyltransferase involved in cell wall biosynthesis
VRILVVSDLYPPIAFGGYERECATVVDHLQERHEVLVLTSDLRRSEAPPDARVLRELPRTRPGRVGGAVRGPVQAARTGAVVRRALAEFRPDLVYVWEAIAISHAVFPAVSRSRVALAYRICVEWATRVYRGDRFFRYLVAGGAAGAAARMANRLPGLRFDASPVSAAVSWVSSALRREAALDSSLVPLLERVIWPATRHSERLAGLERVPAERPTIGYVGRLWHDKGPDVAIAALSALRADYGIDAQLVMAGPVAPGLERELRHLSRRLGVAESVEFVGPVESDGVAAVYRRAHVAVVPSRSEGFGLSAVEAALAGVPVVAANVGGIPEALYDGEHALLFPANDARACAKMLAAVFEDEVSTRQRVERAFQRAREVSSVSRYLSATDEFIADALEAFARRKGPT